MPGSCLRRALPLPIGTDGPAEFRLASTALANVVDGDVRQFSGTISNRATVVPSPLVGDESLAADTGQWFKWSGTAWATMLVARPWTATTPATGIGASPSVRLRGDVVRWKGGTVIPTGTVTAGSTWFTTRFQAAFIPWAA